MSESGHRKIAVVGMAPSSREDAPFDRRPEWEIWGLNTLYKVCGDRWDRWFEMHDVNWLIGRGHGKSGYLEWLGQDHGKPILMIAEDPRIPCSKQYPLQQIVDKYGHWLPDGRPSIYFQSTVDWMLALAIAELEEHMESGGKASIGVFGVDMALSEEYAHQRPSCEYWIGIALGKGIEVHIPDKSDLLKIQYVYGLDTYEPVARKLQQRQKELQDQLNQLADQERAVRDRKMMIRGALDDMAWRSQQRYG